MATHSTTTRGRPPLPEDERKRRKLERDRARRKGGIYIGGERGRWEEAKKDSGNTNDMELATLLLDM